MTGVYVCMNRGDKGVKAAKVRITYLVISLLVICLDCREGITKLYDWILSTTKCVNHSTKIGIKM